MNDEERLTFEYAPVDIASKSLLGTLINFGGAGIGIISLLAATLFVGNSVYTLLITSANPANDFQPGLDIALTVIVLFVASLYFAITGCLYITRRTNDFRSSILNRFLTVAAVILAIDWILIGLLLLAYMIRQQEICSIDIFPELTEWSRDNIRALSRCGIG